MSVASTRSRPEATARRGYVLLTVLLIVSLIVTAAATYAHHTAAAYRTSTASLSIEESRASAQSALAIARRLLAVGAAEWKGLVASGSQDVALTLGDAGTGVKFIRAEALLQGLGTTLEARAEVAGALAGPLPRLTTAAADRARSDPARRRLSGRDVLADAVVDGTLVLARGSACTLRDVVVRGSIVSEAALDGPPYSPAESVTLTVDGSLRVDGDALLPGCAIILPDGALTTLSTSAVEIHGVVLAQTIDLHGQGAADHHIMAAEPCSLPTSLDRPGYGRTPPDWPESLEVEALDMTRLSFPRQAPTPGEAKAIRRFDCRRH